ncbi:Ubiquitin carboxyl-terminal hydrolase 12 [Melia azedarach]|uniref:Ubiquitin carboxyl-terminal hydrolase 12 n=1 Tax=Melia azedarach TaxID=155640 RepID=A0ACC1YT98_MELAZ|nr:Ubiquitin carboxyl-terminal hydrolase 12 [Melia azedarach]
MGSRGSPGSAMLTGRNAFPSHYLFKIESFSLLSTSSVEKYTTDNFEAGGFKWKMHIHLTGDKLMNATDHISTYLELAETGSLPTGWVVNAIINFFIFNQIENKYFGLQVYVVKNTFKGERLSMMKDPPIYNYTWRVKSFSTLANKSYESESFGCYNWKVSLHPNGHAEGKGNSISVFLELSHSIFPPNTKLFTRYLLRVKDQINGNDIEYKVDRLYTPSSPCWGFRQMLTLAKLMDSEQGYLVDDTCIIQAQVTLLGLVLTD